MLFSIKMQNTDLKSETRLEVSHADTSLINQRIGELFLEHLSWEFGGSAADVARKLEDMESQMASMAVYADEEGYSPIMEAFPIIHHFKQLMQQVALLKGAPVESFIQSHAFHDEKLIVSAKRNLNLLRKAKASE